MIVPSLVLLGAGLLATQSPAGAEEPEGLEGRWRLSLALPISQEAPVIGDLERVMQMTAVVDFEDTERGLIQRTSPCGLDIGGGSFLADMEVPDGFVDAIEVPPTPVESGGGRLESEIPDVYLGYAPEEAQGGPPKSPDAPSVRDADRDGNPGVTVRLKLLQFGRVQLFVAQHLHLRLVGERTSPDVYQGDVGVIAFEQNLLDSEPSMPGLAEDLTVTARTGSFTLERVAPSTTCATL